ncbi:unnamed protein product [Arctia plantaginis]|uniref:Kazal-like domain-containing protein n=1 Tax=Arctia plantaginis TaxID=874455 RepID=A0A8S0Z318_ARCPL|nr:unnamed protein product [Arctia plantaginis]
MLNRKILFCVVLVAAWNESQSASLPFLTSHLGDIYEPYEGGENTDIRAPAVIMRAKVREGVPPPLCAGRCRAPPVGPVCAFDAAGTARTFATICELEAVSCRESTYYAMTSLGEC